MAAGVCTPDNNVSVVPTYPIGKTNYFYQPCVSSNDEAAETVRNCWNCYRNYSNMSLACFQFCEEFEAILPWVYFSLSVVSALCCLGVFATYFTFPRLRRSGYSSKVFLYRTLVDLFIALGHIVAKIFGLSASKSESTLDGCRVLGVVNEIALVASNMWYVMLALDLLKAIRNPFSAQPSYKFFSHVTVWGFSFICGVIIVLLTVTEVPGEAGPSMFYWCWVSVGTTVDNQKKNQHKIVMSFAMVSLFLYYFWHFVFWIFSLCVLITAAWIIRGHLTASSETRKFVLKQNFIYVLVLGIETCLILPIWVAQLSVTKSRVDTFHPNNSNRYYPYYLTYTDLGLAIAFAVIHSLRGTIDFFVWLGTFTISYSDIKYLRYTLRKKYLMRYHSERVVTSSMLSPVIKKKDSAVNRTLRRNAIYCINIGILDAIQLHLEQSKPVRRSDLGVVRIEDDCYIDAVLLQSDEEESASNAMHQFPKNGEQSLRRIQFPSSSLLGITSFSFIDLEPSVFSMLRDCYGIDPRNYRASFRIKNAADIESSGMLEKFTEGKSGSFFYFTRDFKYIIKTVTDEEEKFLQKIAYRYYDHMKNNPNSLIVRFFSLHKVRLAREQRYITVVVMENIFHTPDQFKMNECYDLKGSRVGRRSVKKTSKVRREYKGTLKDLDLGDKKIHVGADSKLRLLEQLRRDIEFLVRCKIMDYSLLLGIHYHSSEERSQLKTVSSVVSAAACDLTVHSPANTGITDQIPMERLRATPPSVRSSGYSTLANSLDPYAEKESRLTHDEDDDDEKGSSSKVAKVAWFRDDFGGLRSSSFLHPLHGEEQGSNDEAGCTDSPPATYYFGVVDILQEFNLRKNCEHQLKTKVLCQDKHGISCVNEREYGERFLNFMDEILD